MPTHLHEALVELFRACPALAAELLAEALGVAVPAYEAVRADPADLPDLVPTEYRADAVVVLSREGVAVMAVVVEVQLRRDRSKRWSWPVYVATLRARLRCPVELLVICPHAGIAEWCAAPIALGVVASRMVPLVLGPELVPVVSDSEQARRRPELAVLSAMAHGGGDERGDVLPAMLRALAGVEPEHGYLYFELVYGVLPRSARSYLEEIMKTGSDQEASPFKQMLERVSEARGKAAGEAHAVLAFLDARQIEVSDAQRAVIGECRDLAQLDTWVRRAATATTVEDLFD